MMHLYMKETAYGLYLLSLRKLLTYLLTYLLNEASKLYRTSVCLCIQSAILL